MCVRVALHGMALTLLAVQTAPEPLALKLVGDTKSIGGMKHLGGAGFTVMMAVVESFFLNPD